MATLYKHRHKKNGKLVIGQTWYLRYKIDGKTFWKSLQTKDEKYARFCKKEMEINLAKGLAHASKCLNIQDYYQQYLQDVKYRKVTTNRTERYIVDKFLASLNKARLNNINREDVVSFLKQYELNAPKTYNHVITHLSRFFRLAMQKGLILKNPASAISRKPLSQILPRFFTDEEYWRIEKAAEGHAIYPMVITARYTGLRLKELIHLEWQDFDWDRRLVRVLNKPQFNHTVKNYQSRVVPVSDELRDKLLPFIKQSGICFPVFRGGPIGEKYSDQGPKKALKAIFKKAGIDERKRIGWHEFRHTFASHLVQKNVPIYKVSKWLGHSSLAVTQIYAHFAPVYDKDIEVLSLGENHLMPTLKSPYM